MRWNVTSWLQTALDNDDWQVSTELVNDNETSPSQLAEFGPDPVLTYTFTQAAPSVPVGTGPVSNATQLGFPVSDKVSLQVNVGSGNALVTTSDLTLPEESGPLTLGADYNSLLAGSNLAYGAEGAGWRQREGADVRLYLGSDGTITFTGEDGTAGKFSAPPSGSSTYGSPPVFPVTLSDAPASTCSGASYQMTWHDTGQVMCFNANGLLTSEVDRNGNTTAYGYNGSGQETQVTYTPKGASSPAETVTASYTDLYLTGLSQSGGSLGTRTVTYACNSAGYLASVRQADGTLVQFGYDSRGDLTSIQNGAGAVTTLDYNSSRQVTSVTQPYGSSENTATTRLSYVSSTETQVATADTNQSEPVSSVPNTTYTINSQDLVTKAAAASYAYSPYGGQTTAAGTGASQNPIRYAAALFDAASSNYSTFGARWYNPDTAFFTTQDSNSYLDNPANGNRYAYASDNPANYTDPTGHSLLTSIVTGLITEVVFQAACGAVAFALTAGAAEPTCFIGGSILTGYVGYEESA